MKNGMFMNECIDSTMGGIHVCFAVLLASDNPRTSRSFNYHESVILPKKQPKRLDSDHQMNISTLIGSLEQEQAGAEQKQCLLSTLGELRMWFINDFTKDG